MLCIEIMAMGARSAIRMSQWSEGADADGCVVAGLRRPVAQPLRASGPQCKGLGDEEAGRGRLPRGRVSGRGRRAVRPLRPTRRVLLAGGFGAVAAAVASPVITVAAPTGRPSGAPTAGTAPSPPHRADRPGAGGRCTCRWTRSPPTRRRAYGPRCGLLRHTSRGRPDASHPPAGASRHPEAGHVAGRAQPGGPPAGVRKARTGDNRGKEHPVREVLMPLRPPVPPRWRGIPCTTRCSPGSTPGSA